MESIIGMFAIGPNSACSLLQDGCLVAIAEEERFLRYKGNELEFPFRALHYCLKEGGIGGKDINTIAYAWDCSLYRLRIQASKLRNLVHYNLLSAIANAHKDEVFGKSLCTLMELAFHHPSFVRQVLREYFHRFHPGAGIPKVRFVPHHLAHAASAFYTSGFDQATILTMDRNGENICSAIFRGVGTKIDLVEKYEIPNSLGWFYAGFTEFLGFRPEYEEGKLMGLSAYGSPNESIRKKIDQVLICQPDGSYKINPDFFIHGSGNAHAYREKLITLFGPPASPQTTNEISQYHMDLAYAVQKKIETTVVNLASRAIRLTQIDNLCLAGGVALNCVANGRIAASRIGKRIYIPPHSSDAGAALGAALWQGKQLGKDPRFIMYHANWGPGYNDEEICKTLDRLRVKHEIMENIEKIVAKDISLGLSVGWFQGRMEIGPRALGARSILGDPRSEQMRERLNQIKGREPWRPLAPAILEAYASDYLYNPCHSPFMTMAFDVRQGRRASIPAVTHVDGTTRPQIIAKGNCPNRFYGLIAEFYRITGIPMIINTSFNVHGEPIVCTVEDAVRTFYGSELDVLAIGPARVLK